MFAGFNLKLSEAFFDSNYYDYVDIGKENTDNSNLNEELDEHIINKFKERGALNGDKIIKEWFPEIKCDIFISHSHSDKDLAEAFSGWLKINFGIKAFIDSNVWNYIDSLLEMLNSEYSNKRKNGLNGWLYDHSKCNIASQHANIMLLMALQKMIDNVEAVFFLNTDNSVNVIDNHGFSSTYSPWIYAELLCADLIRKKNLEKYRSEHFLEHYDYNARSESRNELKINYNITTDHLYKLNENNMNEWCDKFKTKNNVLPMDLLYKLFINEEQN